MLRSSVVVVAMVLGLAGLCGCQDDNRRLDALEGSLAALRKLPLGYDTRMLDSRVSVLESSVGDLEDRLGKSETASSVVDATLTTHADKLDALEGRVAALEGRVAAAPRSVHLVLDGTGEDLGPLVPCAGNCVIDPVVGLELDVGRVARLFYNMPACAGDERVEDDDPRVGRAYNVVGNLLVKASAPPAVFAYLSYRQIDGQCVEASGQKALVAFTPTGKAWRYHAPEELRARMF